jgi:hypothetical protein
MGRGDPQAMVRGLRRVPKSFGWSSNRTTASPRLGFPGKPPASGRFQRLNYPESSAEDSGLQLAATCRRR